MAKKANAAIIPNADGCFCKSLYLLKNKDFADKLGKNGKLSIEKKYNINTIMQQYMDLYESLIEYR